MPRTIVYSSRQAAVAPLRGGSSEPVDDYTSRLLKLIPAEVLSFFLVANGIADSDASRWIFLAIGLLGTPLQLNIRAPKTPRALTPQPYLYLLAMLGFIAWALGTSPGTAALFGLGKTGGPIVLVCGSFLLPAVDEFLDSRSGRGAVADKPIH